MDALKEVTSEPKGNQTWRRQPFLLHESRTSTTDGWSEVWVSNSKDVFLPDRLIRSMWGSITDDTEKGAWQRKQWSNVIPCIFLNNRNGSSSSAIWNHLISMSGFDQASAVRTDGFTSDYRERHDAGGGRRKPADCTQVMRLQNKAWRFSHQPASMCHGWVSTPPGTCV